MPLERFGLTVMLSILTAACGVGIIGAPAPEFDIQLYPRNPLTDGQSSALGRAAARWNEVVIGDNLADGIDVSNIPEACIGHELSSDFVVNDLVIFIEVVPLDGLGGMLAEAGPCAVRSDGSPIVGTVRLDSDDVDELEASGQLYVVALHEIGHVLGFGSLWARSDLLREPSLPSSPGADTHFAGSAAIAAFDAAGGDLLPVGNKVPVENTAIDGSADSHWRESVLGDELMSPTIVEGETDAPISAITIASLRDLGFWIVDPEAADDYSVETVDKRALPNERPLRCRLITPVVVDTW